MSVMYVLLLITAPGVIVHELSHALFCVLARVRIHRINLFRFNQVAGFVVHDEPEKLYQSFLISAGPFIINSLLALIFFAWVVPPWNRVVVWVWLWLGVAIGLHAIPSAQDAFALIEATNRRVFRNPLVLACYPFAFALYLLHYVKRFHLDIAYVGLLFWLGNIFLKHVY